MTGKVYTETVVWSPPAELVDAAPYQLVLVAPADGPRVMGRMIGDRVAIGDTVVLDSVADGVHFFRKLPDNEHS
ncbi:MAG: OB-fold domain-containing protein [Acidobacteria bacterium]|nr:OB-fold domain-containing protein [Acidobacteriota bacterium]